MAEPRNLPALWRTVWQDPAHRDHMALVTEQQGWTYGELDAAVRRLAGALRQAGVSRGDYVALAMARGPGQVLALLASLVAGACPCPLEPRLAADETRRRVAAVGLRWMLHDADHADLAQASGIAPSCRLDLDRLPAAEPHWDEGHADGDPALLLFTSGSTGKPKGVLQAHRGVLLNTRGVVAHTGLRPDDVLLHVMPLHHTNAINNQIFAPLACGATVALAGRFRAEDMPDLLERFRPTLMTGVPTMYSRMLQHTFDPARLAGLRMARCGSAPITPALHREIEAFMGCPLVVSYGLSEATCTSTINPPAARRIGTVGTVLPGQRVALLDEQGRAVPDGAEGEVCIGGDVLMLGYLGHDGDSPVRDGWLRTGDLGRFDADGYLSITGRIKDVIIRGGENLSPKQIEDVLSREPAVAACCVVGRADRDLGEVPVAVIVPRPGVAIPDHELLRARVREQLGRIYAPDAIYISAALPENAVGKVDRKAVARWVSDQDQAHGAGAILPASQPA
ncbi:class I adenylate-forming enzyme family protein [Achromobacter aloeverae]|uniref:Long-chain fatty acid--CoA ligase n=1 Tax=Achromobacter aloeverae TaxID=1750518 RepID=A0A4Q1HMV7_9BURK|nr:class I adenylate-forming enzyme family protein [Achromobacter aloeverae]RXN91540.1 long-chain fatty acid--CoA ligase [Achromobacter aloeverae]